MILKTAVETQITQIAADQSYFFDHPVGERQLVAKSLVLICAYLRNLRQMRFLG
jgi:hypothetical protein